MPRDNMESQTVFTFPLETPLVVKNAQFSELSNFVFLNDDASQGRLISQDDFETLAKLQADETPYSTPMSPNVLEQQWDQSTDEAPYSSPISPNILKQQWDQSTVNQRQLPAASPRSKLTLGKKKLERAQRYAFKTRSEFDILDDGYKWRKYGKKFVKNNPNPRNYYRCSDTACNVKKTVERDPHDKESVITTYLGRHNHESLSFIDSMLKTLGASTTTGFTF